ncbi:hypothetical protein BTO06_06245 [Tenacibaculum sp. SZ-18]|uniref:DUF2141 domain-containing protein n=1 Tax=Tenacibaculum sp. SZ-18 TaxID=754423 RepID=UPI000C2D3E06|nr:DUF2141 domain-containing protein [Tenacibaculum sp. SZ-18]AUC14768.1 hypothetical protein BTO06_06245 [Tenacibaculum sp. SZ-18]
MKILVTLTIALTTLFTNVMQDTKTITVTISNATSDKGSIKFGLHNKETFMVKKPLLVAESKIENGKCKIVFKNVPEGEYAITCFHDKNENGKMDFQPNGMPMEAYGASNNVMNFGPPRYDDAKFTVSDKDVSLDIRL